MENEIILRKLDRIEKHICGLKSILNVEELAEYTGFKKSYIYKLVHEKIIPYSKPNGKVLFFERKVIDEWLLNNPSKSKEEIQRESIEFAFKSKKV
ncbi:helix-turn-helix transcriptional regulator [Elizabethkingia anophelis]|uniref:Predicted transcriptional regulator n=1 Tax=Elizabethkingia anophelis TaxID=1117645 RepID=A0A7Z7LZX6_9FLAO|nr:helix-turn-helix domain-containing protein [Elizabethkingia anophelis]MCT3845055.1 helix-turn-helix domain-containing protein [Elizabethkingia anophelis]STF08902.1 Predicted transcriptional regulator [Elizabethkingia anophelis]